MKPKFVTSKEIAGKLEISQRHFFRIRQSLHLQDCRDRIYPRRYFTEQVERKLRESGHEVVF